MKRTTVVTSLSIVALLATACASPTARMGVFPTQPNMTAEQQQANSEFCNTAATNIAGSAGAETATGAAIGLGTGAVVGAALGAIAGAFFGLAGEGAAIGAALGGAAGALQGTAGGAITNREVVQANYVACMRSKGWEVAAPSGTAIRHR